ncbi:hypothetical protein LSM04_003822 [Trypanosoma melophagium]|uniref:uncharacterized protein n=1 Tax=Trypanosoma melophagium TaxID=715481 RepID=UPI003519E059|nr:hypothetical protein LSM04_003822 [Trypanosoma melophagium]
MITDSFPLKVKLGGPALDVMNLFQIGEDLSAAQSTVVNSRNALAKTRIAPSRNAGILRHKDEEEALDYTAKKKAYINAYYLSEDIFSEFQRVLLDTVEEERAARQRLDVFYNDIRRRAVNARREEYFMSTKCVFERFQVEERAHEEKARIMQEYADFLLSAKIVEQEERQVSIRRAQTRRKEALQQSSGVPVPLGVQGAKAVYYPPSSGHNYGATPPPQQQQQYISPPSPTADRPYALPSAFLRMQRRRNQGVQQQQPQTGFYGARPGVPDIPTNSGPSMPLQPQFPQQQQQQPPYWTNHPPGQPGRYGYQGL